MSTEKTMLNSAVFEVLNNVSGTYVAPFWDGLRSTTESLGTVREIKGALEALAECGKSTEAYRLICALHDLAAIELPTDIIELEPYPEGIALFIQEFLLDTEDLMQDYEYEERSQNT